MRNFVWTDREASGGKQLVFERTYCAHVEDLWALWTTKDGFESWWGPEGFQVRVRSLDARAGGALHYDMFTNSFPHMDEMRKLGRSASTETRGKFIECKPYDRLIIAHMIDFIPNVRPYEHRITVEFFNKDDGVRMVITLDYLHDEETTRMSALGLVSQLEKLDRKFGR